LRKPEIVFSPGALSKVLHDDLGLQPGTRLKVAYSGGIDSHALLHALVRLRDAQGFSVQAIHVDHGLQPESGAWARHCREVCRQLHVPCTVERIEVPRGSPDGMEAAARRARYERLAGHVGAGELLLTAHHQDDQAETLLLQLLRGSGVHGMAAMPLVTPFSNGRLGRPLLGFSRRHLTDYARSEGLSWIDDRSNRDTRHTRNFLRQEIMPQLRTRWPEAGRVLARAARNAADAAALLDESAALDLEDCRETDAMNLSIKALARLSDLRLRNLLRYWISRAGMQAPSRRRLQEIIGYIHRPTRSRQAVVSWPGAEVRRYRDSLQVMAPLPRFDTQLCLPWNPDHALVIPGTGYRLEAVTTPGAGLSQARIAAGQVSVRLRQGGEACRLPGRAHRQKLKKLLQQSGTPPWQRQRLPLVYVGDELAAVADRWVCEPFAAAPDEPGLVLRLRGVAAGT